MFARTLGLAGISLLMATAHAFAETPGHPDHGSMGQMMSPQQEAAGSDDRPMMRGHDMHGKHGMMGKQTQSSNEPTLPGQDAFATIQEIVQILEADPKTDWSKVNIAALREHLIDMNEVTLHAAADERALDNGVEITVTGEGRTAEAIKRMVPAHAHELGAMGWNATTEDLPSGVKLVVISDDPAQVTKLKALGFMGIMVQGSHHQRHHLMMAKGEHPVGGGEAAQSHDHRH
jgi:hypothetical protein